MLYFSRWRTATILATILLASLSVVPNLFPESMVRHWPQWAQRRLVLGLDLQGGSHLLLEADRNAVRKEMVERLRDEARRALSEAHIAFGELSTAGDAVEVRIVDGADMDRAHSKLQELSVPVGGPFGPTAQRTLNIASSGDRILRLAPSEAAIDAHVRQAVQQSIQIVERRVNELGTVEPTVQSEGSDRIVVEVPGLQDPTRLKQLLGKTAKLTFQLIDLSTLAERALQGRAPPETEVLYDAKHKPPIPYLVEKRVAVSGEDLSDAQPGFDRLTGEPVVTFRFNSAGARRFADVTRENVGRPFAIVLDNQVISAPIIREPIVGGSGEISGHFSVQEANDLAVLLRAGALPAPLTVVEERTIGPGLGQDSVRAGEFASGLGAALVIVFMLMTYGLFGLFADIAVAMNVLMIFGILSLFDATLTLPGIAGVALTVGIAVDSNVLIYERIREDVRRGYSAISAIDAGFRRALATIVDSNLTTFIAAAVLFFIGTGPVRGFALTLGIGIATTLFTAFTLTRLIVAWWVRLTHPKRVPI
jgi:preprotein translocase subunit SecD